MAVLLLGSVATMKFDAERGFSITELLLTVAVAATIAGMAIPVMGNVSGTMKLNESVRLIERELQDARLKAVSSNRSLRVRINCPAAGFLRRVEVLGTAADAAAGRCSPTAYPFPADDDLITRPNHDGPVRTIPNDATVGTVDIQFNPDGSANSVVAGVAQTMAAPVTVTVTRVTQHRTVTVNSVGKIQLQ